MHLHLVLPGLLWPGTQTADPAGGLDLPALERLLGHGRLRTSAPTGADDWLHAAFALDPQQVSAAALRRLGEEDAGTPSGGADWLCADPVGLSFAREHLILADASTLDIAAGEAAALIDALNDTFADVGRFEAATPERWYLRPAEPPAARFVPLLQAVGRPVARSLPEGADASRWQRVTSEIQIMLHNHPVNRAREEAGRPLINSLWLWGGGHVPASARSPLPAVQAASPEVRGLARAAGIDPRTPNPIDALTTPTLVVLEHLARPALHLDLDAWRNGLAALEREWYVPVLDALKTGRLKTLILSAPGTRATLELTLSARNLWKFWQRPRSLDALHKTLP
ncbi:hypothetical protein [Pseudothauera rhizosphaerae]|uniref:Regulatory protein, RpfE type n=1 Tax=Pseudothauera rhizosphaerae TaxID=2565932 RepID=A0A4S4AMI2_9RHOO|nr:hypothetical protein [Pseudothauera rhizosphaerae]THF60822.1 hypothetical protein E6O51_11295 [Pseudothauera rhizosphaerae]